MLSAAPVMTRSEAFGWKLGHVGPPERSGLTRPPCQPLEPRSARRITTARAAAWSAALNLICSPPPAETAAAIVKATIADASANTVRRVIASFPLPADGGVMPERRPRRQRRSLSVCPGQSRPRGSEGHLSSVRGSRRAGDDRNRGYSGAAFTGRSSEQQRPGDTSEDISS